MKPINVKRSKSPQASLKYKKIELESLEFNWHCHPEYEIMLMHGSRGKRFIGDSISHYSEGDLFFMGPYLPHTWYSPNGMGVRRKKSRAILIQFPENFAGLNIHEVPEMITLEHLFTDAARGIQFKGKTCARVSKLIRKMERSKY